MGHTGGRNGQLDGRYAIIASGKIGSLLAVVRESRVV